MIFKVRLTRSKKLDEVLALCNVLWQFKQVTGKKRFVQLRLVHNMTQAV